MAPLVDPLIGAVVGERYRLVEEIGAGGMATVYRGEHMLLHKSVAVKVLLPDLSTDENMAARFEREAVAAARLEHPNVVSITDFGRAPDGRLFLVMEFLEGTPLDQLIHDELHLAWERAVELVRQILRGLAHAHEVGVVHRDLKPSNVMITAHAGGREMAKIIDFGIAKIVGGSPVGPHVETEAGIVFGTADFLAPERLQGKGESDPRADIYSAGVILYEALTGVRPFHDEEVLVTVQRALHETARPPSAIIPGIPAELDAVVARALAKNPERRYPSARAFLTALDPFVRRSGTTPRPLISGPVSGSTPTPLPAPVPFDASRSIPITTGPLAVMGGDESAAPLALYQPPPLRNRRALWLIPAGLAAVALVIVLATHGGGNTLGTITPHVLEAGASEPPADPDTELNASIKAAGEGATLEERQRGFDRLVALGYSDRVPWVAMLGKDLVQLPTCEERREVVAKLRKIKDPAILPLLQEAAARPDNGCLAADARAAIAARVATPPAAPGEQPAAAPPPRKKRSHGGGHF